MAFIDDMHSQGHAVESVCRVLREQGCQVAARTYRAWKQANRPVAGRTRSDAQVIDKLLAVQGTPEGLYGRRKMTHYLHRQGPPGGILHHKPPDARPGHERGPPRQGRPNYDTLLRQCGLAPPPLPAT